MANDGQAPAIFKRTNAKGVPIIAVLFSSSFALLAFMNLSKSSTTVFGYFVGLVTVFGTLNWISLLVSYLAFRQGMKAQGLDASHLPYRGRLQPYGAIFATIFTIMITVFQGMTIPEFKSSVLRSDHG